MFQLHRRALLAGVTALLLSACSTVEPTPRGLKIATWNLEHLSEQDGVGCRPRTEADYAKLRAYAAALDADVVALQEVANAAAAHRVFPADAYDIVMSAQPYPATQGACHGDENRQIQPQRTGIAIRKGTAYRVNAPLTALNVSDRPGRPLRWGVDVTIETATPVRLLNVHLKSGCAAGAKPDDEDCPMLFRQAPIVEAWIDAREAEAVPYIVLGDFNRRLGASDAKVWQDWDDGDPAGLDLHIAAAEANGEPAAPGCDNAKYSAFIDHIVLSRLAFKRLKRGSFSELVFAETGAAMPSDHCPVSIRLD